MDYRFLENKYFETRKKQIQKFGRDMTEMDKAASEVIFNTAITAIQNVRQGNKEVCMQAVSLGTGVGKSSSAYALIATFAKYDRNFSVAYVVPTVKMAIEAQEGIEALLGEGSSVLWSSYHKHKGVDRGTAFAELGFIPDRIVNKAQLAESRIIIVTHQFLKREMENGNDEGGQKYLGKPRSLIFIDEHPDFLQMVDAEAKELQVFYDDLVKYMPEHPWLPVISNVVQRMSNVMRGEGQTYIPSEILSSEEGSIFNELHGLSLWELTDQEFSDDRRRIQLNAKQDLLIFLKAASKGNCFYSRKDWTFFAYQLHFNADYPGFVLLDATSDLTGLVSLHPNVRQVDIPHVDYRNLDLRYLALPSKFRNMKEVIKHAAVGREYGNYIVQSVLANTSAGDEVLIVVHKDVLTQELIVSANDPKAPTSLEGRIVNTQNWGAGVGLNQFKDKTHVFLFGDYFMPRSATIAHTHAWSHQPITEEGLKSAQGQRKNGDIYAPQGGYLKPHEGHLLRWFKQLAMRGTARQVDESGCCYPMKLFTTMDLGFLLPNLERLFPNVEMPRKAMIPEGYCQFPNRGRQGLIQLLSFTSRAFLGADEIEAVTGITPSKLNREFEAINATVKALGWRVASAKELGLAGRMNYLIHDLRLAKQVLKAS